MVPCPCPCPCACSLCLCLCCRHKGLPCPFPSIALSLAPLPLGQGVPVPPWQRLGAGTPPVHPSSSHATPWAKASAEPLGPDCWRSCQLAAALLPRRAEATAATAGFACSAAAAAGLMGRGWEITKERGCGVGFAGGPPVHRCQAGSGGVHPGLLEALDAQGGHLWYPPDVGSAPLGLPCPCPWAWPWPCPCPCL